MKKIVFLGAVIFGVAACGSKVNEVEVAKLISAPESFKGQTVTFVGKAVVLEENKVAVYGVDDSVANIVVVVETPVAGVVECGKGVKVTGVVTASADGGYQVNATAVEKSCCKSGKDAGEQHEGCAKKDSNSNEVVVADTL